MRLIFTGFMLSVLSQARRPPPPGATDFGNRWLPPGKLLYCSDWFPEDPCFYSDWETKCYEAYDWDHMRYPNRRNLVSGSNAGNTGWANITSIQNGAIEMLYSENWLMQERSISDEVEIEATRSPAVNDKDLRARADPSVFHGYRPNPPCCQWTSSCFYYIESKPPGYQFDGDNEEEEYYKFLCCLTSWAMKCGGQVPFRPKLIRPPPECTMPEGHERVYYGDVKDWVA